MSWIGTASRKQPGAGAATAPKSLEFATTVAGRGLAPARAIVEHMTASECRLRTVVFFDHNAAVEFAFGMPGRRGVTARGRIASRASNGPRFVYRIVLDRMSASEADELSRAVNEVHRRHAHSRSLERAVRELPTTDGPARTSVRVTAQFPIRYRTAKEQYKDARAADISSSGMLMTCSDALVEGMAIELRFTPPSEILNVHPEETAVLDLRNRTVIASGRPNLRRPFDEIVVMARVVTHQPLLNGQCNYGLAFQNLDGYTHEELARYAHAAQLNKKRR